MGDAKAGTGYFVGIDLHKKFMQVAVMDSKGTVLRNRKIKCEPRTVRREFSRMPPNTRYVLESSSVWYGTFRLLTDELGLDVILSNPYTTRLIAQSKKKTDRVDARILADMLCGGYISACHVPDAKTVQNRQLVRHRARLVESRTRFKNMVHGILLQNGAIIDGTPYTAAWTGAARRLGDWRIDGHLRTVAFLDEEISACNIRIREAMKDSKDARLLTSITGVGEFTALTLASEIDGIGRFCSMDSLASYFGLVPSVRRSADTVHHGAITKVGNSMVRQLLIEAVLTHVSTMRRRVSETPVTSFYGRLAKKRGMAKARVAAAVKLLRIIYWMLRKRIDFDACVAEGRKSTYCEPGKRAGRIKK